MGVIARFRSAINYRIGNVIRRLGYTVVRSDRVPKGNLNLIEAAFAMLTVSGRDRIRIVQVGAFDGIVNDPLARILRNRLVDAILLEPQVEPFHLLETTYQNNSRIQLENAALANRSGNGVLYVPTASTASPRASLIASHRFRFGGSSFHEVPIRLITVEDLFVKHGWQSCDMVQVDAEGSDLAIVQMFFNAAIEPPVINLESHHLSREERSELRQMLIERGYRYVDWGLDTLAFRRSLFDWLIE